MSASTVPHRHYRCCRARRRLLLCGDVVDALGITLPKRLLHPYVYL